MWGSSKGHVFGLRSREGTTVLELDALVNGATAHNGKEASAGAMMVDAIIEGGVLPNEEIDRWEWFR